MHSGRRVSLIMRRRKSILAIGCGFLIVYTLAYHRHDITVVVENVKLANELSSLILKSLYSVNYLSPLDVNSNVSSPLWRVPVEQINGKAVIGGIRDYLTDFKNPCWFEDSVDASGLRCLPYFYLAGVAKCGTTALYDQLVKHPDILGGAAKEMNFWQFPRKHNVGGYLRLFESANKEIYLNKNKQGYHQKIIFEATPSILTSSYGVFSNDSTKTEEPTYTLAHTLHALNPETKMIVSMRNPTERIFSHYHFRHQRHLFLKEYSPEEFHNLSVTAVGMMTDCLAVKPLRACAFDQDLTKRIEQEQSMTLSFGMYFPYVAEWLKLFPRDQIMFIKAEEIYHNATKTISEIFDFLQVGSPPSSVIDDIARAMSRKYKLEHKSDATNASYRTTMWPETRKILDQFYDQFNSKLAELLGHDKWLFGTQS